MTQPLALPVPELLALAPADLAALVDMCPGDYVSTRAAVLGLDLEVPEHRRALVAAFPDAFSMLQLSDQPVSAGETGVRAALTPDAAPEPDAPVGEPPADQPAQNGAQPAAPSPADIAELLAAYRGRPEPFLCGTFAAYSAPDGSIVVVTEMPDRGTEQHVIPGRIVQLGLSAMNGRGMFGRLLG